MRLAEMGLKIQSATRGPNWYALLTRHQHEKSVSLSLSSKSHEVYLPLYRSVRRWQDRAKQLWLPLFPCYVFVREGMDQQLQILTTPGVVHIVGWGGHPAIVPQTQLDAVRQIIESCLKVESHPYLECGDRVRVKTGPLMGLEGILTRKKGVARLILSLEMLGRSAAVEIDVLNVRESGFSRRLGYQIEYPCPHEWRLSRKSNSRDTMDLSLFQTSATVLLISPKRFETSDARRGSCFVGRKSHKPCEQMRGANLHESGPVVAIVNLFRESFSIARIHLVLTFLLMATPSLAQSVPGRISQSAQPETFVGIERLQQTREKLAEPATEPLTSESLIGPDDLLNITIFEAPEMNCTVRVSASGEISLQLLGAVHAAGLAPTELETVLQGLLRRTYMKDPHLGVFIQELQSHPVSVVGAVKMPGVFQIRGEKTLIEILSMAQGLADDAGDTVLIMRGAGLAESASPNSSASAPAGIPSISLARHSFAKSDGSKSPAPEDNGEIEAINLKKLLGADDSALNVRVRPGDIVKVPRAGIVYVVGEVQKPGGFVLQNNENISVLQALALAEGPTHTSAMGRTRIIRTDPATGKRSEIPMNLAKIVSGKAPDSYLQPKDIVFVPNSTTKSVLYRGSEAALQTAAGVAIYKW